MNGKGEISREHIFPFSKEAVESLYGKLRNNNCYRGMWYLERSIQSFSLDMMSD